MFHKYFHTKAFQPTHPPSPPPPASVSFAMAVVEWNFTVIVIVHSYHPILKFSGTIIIAKEKLIFLVKIKGHAVSHGFFKDYTLKSLEPSFHDFNNNFHKVFYSLTKEQFTKGCNLKQYMS